MDDVPQGYRCLALPEIIKSGDKLYTPNSPVHWRRVGGSYVGKRVDEFYPMKFARRDPE
jgi:hypothetical protein